MKLRILALMAIVAVTFTAVPAVAGHPHAPRHKMYRHGWAAPFHMPPPPPMRHYYRPPMYPMYAAPRLYPGPRVPGAGYWIPGRYYYYDEPGLEIGVARGGLGLHIEF